MARTNARLPKNTHTLPASKSAVLSTRSFAPHIQAKLAVGQPNDQYEQEADRVADSVVNKIQRMQSPEEDEVQMKHLSSNLLQKQEANEQEDEEIMMKPDLQREAMAEEEEEVMMKSEHGEKTTASEDIESAINQQKGSGSALPDIFRSKVEQAIGADFGGVRVHTDQEADTLSRSLSARAFTTGNDIFFKQGEYNPSSIDGQRLLTHELTHTVQQNPKLIQKAHDGMMTSTLGNRIKTEAIQLKGGGKAKKGSGFEAGVPSAWHVHYDHIKYGSNGSTRVNFSGRSAAKVLEKLNEILDGQPGLREKAGLQACINWINDNV